MTITEKIKDYIQQESNPDILYHNIKKMLNNCKQYPSDAKIKEIQALADKKMAELKKPQTLEEISERLKKSLKDLEKIDDKFYLMISQTKTTDEEAENYNKLTTIILLLRELINE